MPLEITDTSYAGEVSETFISQASTEFDTVNKGCIMVYGGIKKSTTIPAIKVDAFIQASQETPTHGGEIGVDARVLTPQDVMGYLEFNPRIFEQHWKAVEMNPQLLDAELPHTAEAAIVSKVLEGNQSWMDTAIWQSVKDPAAIATAIANGLKVGDNSFIFFDGLMKKMLGDSNVIKIATPVAITEANVFDKFKAVKASILKRLKRNPKMKYLVDYNTAEIYENAQQGQANKGAVITDEGIMKFGGKDVVPIAGFPDNTIIACVATSDEYSNLWMGVNEVDEDQVIQIAKKQANSEKYFIKMLMKLDVNFAWGDEIVLYTTATF